MKAACLAFLEVKKINYQMVVIKASISQSLSKIHLSPSHREKGSFSLILHPHLKKFHVPKCLQSIS